jgi:hypothetical protein
MEACQGIERSSGINRPRRGQRVYDLIQLWRSWIEAFRPFDPIEQAFQFRPSRRIQPFDIGDAAQEMATEIAGVLSILRRRPVAHAVEQDRLQLVERLALEVRFDVDDDPGKMLANALPHEAALAKVKLEAFLKGDDADEKLKAAGGTGETFVAGERFSAAAAATSRCG